MKVLLLFLFTFYGLFCCPGFASDDWSRNLTPVKLVQKNDHFMVLDNFRWGSAFDGQSFQTEYGRAKIQYEEVDKVYFCSEDFPPKIIASHISLAFTFKSGSGILSPDGKKSANGLVISVTNRLRHGESSNSVVKAFLPAIAAKPWPLVTEVGSLKDRVHNSITIYNQTINMYPLLTDHAQTVKILKAGLDFALVDRTSDLYHVIHNNCVVTTFQILKNALGSETFPDFWVIPDKLLHHSVCLPKFSPGYLKKKGLITGDKFTLSANARTVSIPTFQGPYKIDLTTLPGYGHARDELVPLAVYLEDYIQLTTASEELLFLCNNYPPGSHSFLDAYDLRMKILDTRDDVMDGILSLFKKHPEKSLTFYIKGLQENKLLRDSRYNALNKKLFWLVQDDFSTNPVNADKEYLDALKIFNRMPR